MCVDVYTKVDCLSFSQFMEIGWGGKDEQSAGNLLEAGNAASKSNSINKTMSFSFSSQNGGYDHFFLLCI